MFAEIVPEELRSTIYAFDRSFEGGVAAMAMPLVGEAPARPSPACCNARLSPSHCALLLLFHTRSRPLPARWAETQGLVFLGRGCTCLHVNSDPTASSGSLACTRSCQQGPRRILAAGLIAEQAFGFSGQLGEGASRVGTQAGDAAALSSSLLVCLMVPWALCLLFYCGAPCLPCLLLVALHCDQVDAAGPARAGQISCAPCHLHQMPWPGPSCLGSPLTTGAHPHQRPGRPGCRALQNLPSRQTAHKRDQRPAGRPQGEVGKLQGRAGRCTAWSASRLRREAECWWQRLSCVEQTLWPRTPPQLPSVKPVRHYTAQHRTPHLPHNCTYKLSAEARLFNASDQPASSGPGFHEPATHDSSLGARRSCLARWQLMQWLC